MLAMSSKTKMLSNNRPIIFRAFLMTEIIFVKNTEFWLMLGVYQVIFEENSGL
jgi:hypothetical protein